MTHLDHGRIIPDGLGLPLTVRHDTKRRHLQVMASDTDGFTKTHWRNFGAGSPATEFQSEDETRSRRLSVEYTCPLSISQFRCSILMQVFLIINIKVVVEVV